MRLRPPRASGPFLAVATLTLALAGCTGAVVTPSGLPSPTAVGTSPTAAPTASPTPPSATTQRVVFGDPWSKKPQRVHAVAESALDIIDRTGRGETVTLSMFNLTYATAADTLIRAHRRGVKVHVLLNSENADSVQATKLLRVLRSNTGARSWVVIRTRSVRMHSKFLLSSKSGGKADVVWVSSGNLTRANGRTQANEALITTGDKVLYDFLSRQFTLMRTGVTDPRQLARSVTTTTAIAQTFPLPEGGPDHDPVLKFLSDVSCVHGGQKTRIRVAHLFLTGERHYLVDRFRELEADGCDVRMVAHLLQWTPRARKALIAPGAGRIDLRSLQGFALHTKITTIEGWDASGRPLVVALVGTHNLTGRALAATPEGVNDELALTIHNPATVATYAAWVDLVIRDHSTPVT